MSEEYGPTRSLLPRRESSPPFPEREQDVVSAVVAGLARLGKQHRSAASDIGPYPADPTTKEQQ